VPEALGYLVGAAVVGIGATVVMDLWALIRKRLLGVPSLDYALVGRWFVHLARGRFRHDPIGASPPVAHERLIGWTAHYLTGIAFAAVLLAFWGLGWVCRPAIGPALVVGIGSVVAVLPDAAEHGRRHRGQPHAAPRRRALAQPGHARHLRARALCGRVGGEPAAGTVAMARLLLKRRLSPAAAARPAPQAPR
jgi:hypothetical protein